MGFEVQVQALRDDAAAAREALRVVRECRAPQDLRGTRPGMPGADAATLVDSVAAGWEEEVADWVAAAHRYARGLDAAADRYEADDEAARAAFAARPPGGAR